MRQIARHPLDAETLAALAQRQHDADNKQLAGSLDVNREWDSARKTVLLRKVMTTLKAMMGAHERCMYCFDSHGTDIEHFWPKKPYPQHMFEWPNLLLCCTECNRFKGDSFPLDNGAPLLIDPTAENPWDYLDFDPTTGNLVARFQLEHNAWSRKGQQTVDLLQLDQREALAAGYRKTHRRLSRRVREFLAAPDSTTDLPAQLVEDDDHALLGWCLNGLGQTLTPFVELRQQHPAIWQACLAAAQV